MEKEVCIACRKPKATLTCEVCEEFVCKNCVQFLEPTTFSFFKEIPAELSHFRYCSACYDSTVGPALVTYQEIMEKARGLHFFFTTRVRPVPILRKGKDTLRVEECTDRDETILRLAFLAVEQGFNAVIEAEI